MLYNVHVIAIKLLNPIFIVASTIDPLHPKIVNYIKELNLTLFTITIMRKELSLAGIDKVSSVGCGCGTLEWLLHQATGEAEQNRTERIQFVATSEERNTPIKKSKCTFLGSGWAN